MEIIKKIVFEIKMHIIDARWRSLPFHSCWAMYPPSFYYRYTPEEQKRIKEKDFAELRAMIAELDNG